MPGSKTYLVLGANGFVGRYLVEALSQKNNITVKAFDRYSSEQKFSSSESIVVVKGDIFNDSDITAALDGVDYVIHSFSATTPYTSDMNPYLDMTDNVINSIRIFERCAELGIKKIAFISSGGAVYGVASENGEVTEESAPLPVSPYGIGKLTIEHYLEYFKRKTGLEYVVYRLTNPYGPGQATKHNQGVIPSFIDKLQRDENITIYGDGSVTRDYIYIEDAASMILDSLQKDSKFTTYNIGSGKQTSLKTIVESLETLTQRTIGVEYKEAPKTFLHKTPVSIERFEKEFGKSRLTELYDGLAKTLGL